MTSRLIDLSSLHFSYFVQESWEPPLSPPFCLQPLGPRAKKSNVMYSQHCWLRIWRLCYYYFWWNWGKSGLQKQICKLYGAQGQRSMCLKQKGEGGREDIFCTNNKLWRNLILRGQMYIWKAWAAFVSECNNISPNDLIVLPLTCVNRTLSYYMVN